MNGQEFARINGKYSTVFIGTAELTGQNINGNYSTFKLRVYGYYGGGTSTGSSYGTIWISGTEYNIGNYRLYPGYTLMAEKDITIYHNNDGSFPYTTQAFAINSYHANGEVSGQISAPNIPRQANITRADNFNSDGNPYLEFTNPGGFKVDAYLEFSGKTILKEGIANTGNYTFQLTQEERNLLLSKCPNSNTLNVRFGVQTTIGSTQYWSWLDRTMTVVNANPKFTLFDFEDVNTKTLALTGNKLNVIKGYSDVKATIMLLNKAVAQKYSTMSKYRFACGDKSTDITYSASTDVNGTINGVTNGTFNVYAIDSRNNSTLVTKLANKTVDYKPLEKGNITVNRNNGVSEEVTLKINGKIDSVNFGAKTNSITYSKYRYKATKTPNWSEYQDLKLTVKDGVFTFDGLIKGDTEKLGFDINNSYQFEVVVEDELSSVTFTANLSSGIPNIALAKNGVGIMGKYDEDEGGLLQVGGKDIMKKNLILVYLSSNVPITVEWKYLSFDKFLSIGDKLTLSNGRVKVGKGVSKVKVSGTIFYEEANNGSYIWNFIKSTSGGSASAILSSSNYFNSSSISESIFEVQEGTEIFYYLNNPAYSSKRTVVRSGIENTWLLVEVIE